MEYFEADWIVEVIPIDFFFGLKMFAACITVGFGVLHFKNISFRSLN
jgi:hypothetical protein